MSRSNVFLLFFGVLVLMMVGLGTALVFPWRMIEWGRLRMVPERTITVIGEAKRDEQNKIARFSAGVSAVNDNKETAVGEVNKKIAAITEAVKTFGIDSKDIQSQNMSIYQGEETYWEDGRQKQRQGQWRVNNTIEVVLRKVDRANDLADLITKSGANNVYGPSFSLDDTNEADDELIKAAMEDARKKAEKMAGNAGVVLGEVVAVNELSSGGGYYPLMRPESGGGGGGAGLEPGSSQVSKTVTVVYAVR